MNTCETCGMEFATSKDINSSRFCCEHCRRVYIGKRSAQLRLQNGTLHSQLSDARKNIKNFTSDSLNGKPGICQFCGKECRNRNSLINHERLCKLNPNRQDIKSWTHNEKWIAKAGKGHVGHNHYTKAKRLGLPMPEISDETRQKLSKAFSGKHHSKETKELLSQIRSSQLDNQAGFKDVKWYRIKNINGDEFVLRGMWEVNVALKLNNDGILWERGRQIPYVDDLGQKRTYNPDFYIPQYGWYIEVKGYYSAKDKRKMFNVCNQHPDLIFLLIDSQRYGIFIHSDIQLNCNDFQVYWSAPLFDSVTAAHGPLEA